MLTVFLILSTLNFLFLFTIWAKSDALNFALKVGYGGMLILSVVCLLMQLGMIGK